MKSTTLQIPEESVEEVWSLLDELHRQQATGSENQARYRLWRRIEQLFPKVDFRSGEWRLDSAKFYDLRVTDEPLRAKPKLTLDGRPLQ